MISAFGPRAQAFAQALGDMDAVIADMSMLDAAHGEAARRRAHGERFAGMVLFEEPRAMTTLSYAWQVLAQIADFDMRRAALDQLGEGRLQLGAQQAAALWRCPQPLPVRSIRFFRWPTRRWSVRMPKPSVFRR